jgi:hypothetical protein
VRFVDVAIRQAHPGEERGTYRSYEEKLEGAHEGRRAESIPWTVLVDDYAGTWHRAYSGEMTDPVFLIDADGRVAFYLMWAHAPTMKRAIDELLERAGRGVVAGGIDRTPHLFASFVNGYHGLRRGGRRAVREYDIGAFGAGTLTFLGSKARPVLAPLALRAEPLPWGARLALLGGAAVAVLGARSLLPRRRA